MTEKLTSKFFNSWFRLPDKVRFILVGGFNAIVSFVIFVLLIYLFAKAFQYQTSIMFINFVKSKFFIPLAQQFTFLKHLTFIQFTRQLCLALSWFLSSFVSFTTQRYFVFRAQGDIVKQYLKCLSSWMVSYCINAVLLELFSVIFSRMDGTQVIKTDISQFFAVGISAIATYVLFKHFAFKNSEPA